ncbi:biotin-dependent carboxyltransferase family protein [Rathayibacter sp. SD072]|uniref:5-oxoprolinase subunit C family protein n=1 Tax=Rathayibacter sp. SD072 TaxID=2781731 RepID=UPI001A95F366|nr:biotin-dependent carboxyltransferase family protein [Rathayibacter sp. SD072]MBO0982648.1 biotin-dependent carboxyltransferase family protein [Rathayibacter sp. SD072]
MTITTTVRVVSTGWLTTLQDLGRHDAERLGVPTGGAADQNAATIANVLVGNARGATLLESMGGELALIPKDDVLIAVTGTPAVVTVDDTPVDQWAPVVVPAGHRLSISGAHAGARSYLALHGTLHADLFLGSAAPDARMGFSQSITAGRTLELTTAFQGFHRTFFEQSLFRLPIEIPAYHDPVWSIDLVAGSLTDRIAGFRDLIASSLYTVTDRSNHVGLRLDGPVLHPEGDQEIVSHGVPIGAVEIPHGDELILLGRYRTLTAGYPIVGFATREAQSLLGQVAPGRRLAFRWVDRTRAHRRLVEAQARIEVLEDAVSSAFTAAGLGRAIGTRPMNVLPDVLEAQIDDDINATVF